MSPLRFYQDQAARQTLAAEQASLQNVRERCERAAKAWDALAARSGRTDSARSEAALEKLSNGMSENSARGLAAATTSMGAS